MLPDTGFSEEEIIETAEKFLETKKTSGSYENYQFEISVHKGELLIAFADITSLKMEEQKYFIFSLLVAFVLGILWIYPAWKITGKIVAPLEEANRLQKEFVLFAGHELKTPVTVMKASLDMLEREGIHSKYLDYAAEENEKMRKLVIELLDYSKMEYQEEKSFRESVNFSQCIEGISLEFEAMAFEKAVILITDIQQNLVIDGNKEMLERMAETLLENAIRHTEAGKEVKIVRTMPNTPAMVGEGMTAVCPNEHLTEDEIAYVKSLLESFSRAEIVPERLMDVVTAVSGSSPAYLFMLIEAMADAAVSGGMPRKQAYQFAAQAVLGSAKMVLDTGKHPGELKDMVCSPAGTTIEAVRTLEELGFRSSIIEAMKVCEEMSRSL